MRTPVQPLVDRSELVAAQHFHPLCRHQSDHSCFRFWAVRSSMDFQKTPREIAKEIKRRHIPISNGRLWDRSPVHRILRNENSYVRHLGESALGCITPRSASQLVREIPLWSLPNYRRYRRNLGISLAPKSRLRSDDLNEMFNIRLWSMICSWVLDAENQLLGKNARTIVGRDLL